MKEKESKFRKICDEITEITGSMSTDKKYYEAKAKQLSDKYASSMMSMGRMNNNSKGVQEMDRHMTHLKKEIENTNEKTVHGLENRDG